jgi:sialic acid synthase SpsE/mannose-6-phosphate isomerase-like protein (cupin superfamily)
MAQTIPTPLFVLEMANNHMGNVEHGLRIIREFGAVVKDFPFHFAFKLQYRNLDTFIHPDYRNRSDVKYIKRFQETRIGDDDFRRMVDEMRRWNFVPMCTAFDEASVDKIEDHGFGIVKIASCSVTDWPLLERIAKVDKPVIASTAGASLEDIDRVVSYFLHRGRLISLMHCVGEYPTPPDRLQLNQLDLLKERYGRVAVGYSTHEPPDNCEPVQLAIAKGARIFEKHVGVPTEQWPLNNYSATPQQVANWLRAAQRAYDMCGVSDTIRAEASEAEMASLRSLRRGVFAKRQIRAGETVTDDDVFLAFPPQENQVTANDWSKYAKFVAMGDIPEKGALTEANVTCSDTRQQISEIVQRVKALLIDGHVIVPGKADLEISHHYGLENFDKYGLVLITVVNREYCKKLIVMLPGQTHPEQFHLKKEETFHILHGEMQIALDGKEESYRPGDVIMVDRGVRHMFYSQGGAVFEEISSTHYKDDSYYTDPTIQANTNRKTLLTHWMQ